MKKSFYAIGIILLASTSCVPGKKFTDVKAKYEHASKQNEELKSDQADLEGQNGELTSINNLLTKAIDQLITDTTNYGAKHRSLSESYQRQLELNRDIEKKLESILRDDASENKKILSQLELNRLKLQEKEDELNKLAVELNEKKSKLDQLQDELIEREQRVNELEEMMAKKDQAVKLLKEKLKQALAGFEGNGLSIEQKNGKIYVSVEANLLFPSGSTNIDPEGKEALVKVAQVLEGQNDLDIMVEGHTDTDKISRTSSPKNNWELSVLRATSVVEIMLNNSNMDPSQITAAGRSYFSPISEIDKAKNRRIEIILQPKLDELYQILEN